MRRKRRVFYTVKIPNHWYSYRLRKWVHENEAFNSEIGTLCSSQFFKTCKVLYKDWPVNTEIIKWYYKKGHRYCITYIQTRRYNNVS